MHFEEVHGLVPKFAMGGVAMGGLVPKFAMGKKGA